LTFELVIISGKGGTGKTSVTAALAALARPVVMADCDVDAPDLHLLTQPRVYQQHEFSGGRKAQIDAEQCLGCGQCADICRFGAVGEASSPDGAAITYVTDPFACEGCGACVPACPTGAVRFEPVVNGAWFVSETRFGPMVHARLQPGEENSGKLVTVVRREARALAERDGFPLMLVDGSPGVGCPVIASLTNADLALIVAEPTLSGLHDAGRVLELADQLHVATVLCVNRWDLSPRLADRLESEALARGASPVGRVREDLAIVHAQIRARAVTELTSQGAVADLYSLRDRLRELIPAMNTGRSQVNVQGATHENRRPD
jgi:MinD superfamily P-loop ATPase